MAAIVIGLIILLSNLVISAALPIEAQTVAQKPSFEVTSVKLNNSGSRFSRTSTGPDGSLRATNVTLRGFIPQFYGVPDYQVVGGPDWINTARFDIEGKPQAGLTDPDVAAMMQSLFEDRFQLKIHREVRELPVFLLTVAKDGSKLQRTIEGRAALNGLKPGTSRTNATSAGGEISGSGIAIPKLIEMLVTPLGRPVIDKTNVTGQFDFTLKWSSASNQLRDGLNPVAEPNGASIFTAIQEQLGLRLESSKEPVDVLVIDSMQKPTEN